MKSRCTANADGVHNFVPAGSVRVDYKGDTTTNTHESWETIIERIKSNFFSDKTEITRSGGERNVTHSAPFQGNESCVNMQCRDCGEVLQVGKNSLIQKVQQLAITNAGGSSSFGKSLSVPFKKGKPLKVQAPTSICPPSQHEFIIDGTLWLGVMKGVSVRKEHNGTICLRTNDLTQLELTFPTYICKKCGLVMSAAFDEASFTQVVSQMPALQPHIKEIKEICNTGCKAITYK